VKRHGDERLATVKLNANGSELKRPWAYPAATAMLEVGETRLRRLFVLGVIHSTIVRCG
jgi:hypothetical protein